MTTRDEVLAAINRIERAGHAGELTRTARLELLMLPSQDYDRILSRLRAAFPEVLPPDPPPRRPDPPSTGPPNPTPHEAREQRGIAVQAMKNAESALSRQQSMAGEFDRQVVEALLHAHKTTSEGRELLDDLDMQIATAARTWDLSTAAGAREFQRFLIGKLRQIVAVVQDANDDDTSKQALAAAWAALYAAQGGRDGPAGTGQPGRDEPPAAGAAPPTDSAGDADPTLAADLPAEAGPEPAARAAAAGPPAAAPMRPAPDFGAGMPATVPSPFGGVPFGFPGFPQPLHQQPDREQPNDDTVRSDVPTSADADRPAEAGEEDLDNGPGGPAAAPDSAPGSDSTTVKLPDGDTVTAPTPELAAVLRAAAGGMPIPDAFRQNGITIPPPGTPVSGQLDPTGVHPGDIGMFTDRHALAVGNGKALLDGQIQYVGNIRGPSFLGWQHPPTPAEQTRPIQTPTHVPTPTRPSATAHA